MKQSGEKLMRIAGPVEDHGHVDYLVYEPLNRALRELLPKLKGKLLDVGCGNKPYRELATSVTEYVGCDVAQSSDNEVDVLMSGETLPFSEEIFDSVLCTQVIEHVESPLMLVGEISRVLKPGGALILSGPMYWPLHEEPQDYFRFTKYGVEALLNSAGLKIISIHSQGGSFSVAGLALNHAISFSSFNRRWLRLSINKIFRWLDLRFGCSSSTINWVILAQKMTTELKTELND